MGGAVPAVGYVKSGLDGTEASRGKDTKYTGSVWYGKYMEQYSRSERKELN